MTRFNAKHPAKAALLLLTALSAAVAATALPSRFALAQDPGPKNDLGNEVAPPPPSIGADIPLTYFGPAPSTVQKELIGPYQLLRAGTVNDADLTVTLPLYKGKLASGEAVWFILTDTNDRANADALGLNFSAKLGYADVGKAVRPARQEKVGSITFERGKVNFAPELVLVPGDAPNYFPPKKTEPGSVGDADYSPLMRVSNAGGAIYNAPMVAFNVGADVLNKFCEGKPDRKVVHNKVTRICPKDGTVTLSLTLGFSFARPVMYLSTDANVALAATMEDVTLAPGMSDIGRGGDDSAFSAVERLFPVVNGPMGKGNPQRQGFNSALAGEGGPLNTLGGIPTIATDYSPIWDLNPVVWTKDAIDKGYRSRVNEEFFILGLVKNGWMQGLKDGGTFGSVGIVVNCPVVKRLL